MKAVVRLLHRPYLPLVLILPALAVRTQQLSPELYAGFKAGFTSSAVFHARRELDQIKQDELGGLGQSDNLPDPVVDRETKSVSCVYAKGEPPRIALFVDRLGTVLLPPGATLENARDLPRLSRASTLTRISHQSLPMTGATGEKCSGDSIEVNRVRIFHTDSPFSLSLHKGICRTKWYPSLPAGVKNPG